MKLGIIGCGNIAGAYFSGGRHATNATIKACADLNMDAARARAEEFGVTAMTVDELLADPEIELVVNLTIPQAHVPVGLQCLAAGKHVYAEKPFAVSAEEGRKLLAAAEEAGLRVGCAPDTFLGGGYQTARKLVDDGWVGRVVAGTAVMAGSGHESWHPNPGFYYAPGGGPMLDMGPYYLTALVHLLGPVEAVCAFTGRAHEERVATSEGAFGQRMKVEVDTHQAGTVRFASGAIVSVIMSFDVKAHRLPRIDLFGTEGTVECPDPNTHGGPVAVHRGGERHEVPLLFPQNARMIGVVDMVDAIRNDRPHRASGHLAQHILEVMLAFTASSRTGQAIAIKTPVDQPAAVPQGLAPWVAG